MAADQRSQLAEGSIRAGLRRGVNGLRADAVVAGAKNVRLTSAQKRPYSPLPVICGGV
ncbi:MAG TPA: hypothetical protein VHG52_08535 [Thermomicrobiales bacterium]|nr:hypothetical protein [Thermomicrobiales bacterium]